MIVIDSSVLVAILRGEADADRLVRVVALTDRCCMSALSAMETAMVLAGREGSDAAWEDLDAFVERANIEIVALDAEQARIARDAFLRFGKGRHPAGLNLGDCASYVLARHRNLPLLFKGNDFSRTDIAPAIARASLLTERLGG